METKIVKNKGGIWCFRGLHLLPHGSEYVIAPDGATTCREHQHDAPKEINLAGSLE